MEKAAVLEFGSADLGCDLAMNKRFPNHEHTSLRKYLAYMLFGNVWDYYKEMGRMEEGK